MKPIHNPGHYRPGDLFRHTVEDSPKLIELAEDGRMRQRIPEGEDVRHALVVPADPLDPYSLASSQVEDAKP